MMNKNAKFEAFIWCIAFPGFGQLLNGKLVKGIILIVLELLINSLSGLNEMIIYSYHGNIDRAIHITDYQWLMFYPCVYMFGIWDAYKDADGGTTPYAAAPFAFGAFFGTIGVIFSRNFLGAMWLGLLGLLIGVIVGLSLKKVLRTWDSKREEKA